MATSIRGAYRREQDGWIYAKLQGSPHDIGYEYGQLMAPEIDDVDFVIHTEVKYTGRDWNWYRAAAMKVLWPKMDKEYREELAGLADGLRSKGYKYDTTDMLVHNGWIELAWYYVPKLDAEKNHAQIVSRAPLSCSAFIATGSETKDGKIVMAHSCWLDYAIGARYNAVLDVTPRHGHSYVMDTLPGFIHSGDDFAINSDGILVTETTIGGFAGFKEDGVPEFDRAIKAVQYSDSIDDFARIMTAGNNGGYANTWLVGDTKTNEIAQLELGLINVDLQRSTDGYFVGANFPINPKLISQECTVDLSTGSNPCNDRHVRWDKLMTQYKGQVDAPLGEQFLADHHDQVRNMDGPSSSTLCGHYDLEDRPGFLKIVSTPDHDPMGSVNGKVTTSDLAKNMSFWARSGHPCGEPFYAKAFLDKYPNMKGWAVDLKDMPSHPWTLMEAAH